MAKRAGVLSCGGICCRRDHDQARSRAIDWLRIAPEKGQESVVSAPHGPLESEWEEVAPGISCNLLATDAEKDRVSMLVRLAPGAAYPPHRHAGVEELYLLDGELMIDDKTLRPGDYNRALPGTGDQRVWSETGCTCVLLTFTGMSFADVVSRSYRPSLY